MLCVDFRFAEITDETHPAWMPENFELKDCFRFDAEPPKFNATIDRQQRRPVAIIVQVPILRFLFRRYPVSEM